MKGSMRERRLRVRFYFTSSVPRVFFVLFGYTPLNKNIKTTIKNEEKDIIYNFKFRNFNSFFICTLAFMLNLKILFWNKIRPMSRTIEYKGTFFIKYFVDPLLVLITSKIRLGILSTSFWCWTKVIFPMRLRLLFWVLK